MTYSKLKGSRAVSVSPSVHGAQQVLHVTGIEEVAAHVQHEATPLVRRLITSEIELNRTETQFGERRISTRGSLHSPASPAELSSNQSDILHGMSSLFRVLEAFETSGVLPSSTAAAS